MAHNTLVVSIKMTYTLTDSTEKILDKNLGGTHRHTDRTVYRVAPQLKTLMDCYSIKINLVSNLTLSFIIQSLTGPKDSERKKQDRNQKLMLWISFWIQNGR